MSGLPCEGSLLRPALGVKGSSANRGVAAPLASLPVSSGDDVALWGSHYPDGTIRAHRLENRFYRSQARRAARATLGVPRGNRVAAPVSDRCCDNGPTTVSVR